jgi:hypothetical protein
MAVSIDDYDDLTTFVCRLMSRTGRPGESATDYFRGVEVRCAGALGGRRWTVYGKGLGATCSFSSEIGWDEEDYVTDRLIKSTLLPVEQLS